MENPKRYRMEFTPRVKQKTQKSGTPATRGNPNRISDYENYNRLVVFCGCNANMEGCDAHRKSPEECDLV